MAFLDLLNFLRTEYKPGPGQFLPINMPQLVSKLRIRERGSERGAQGIPAPDAITFDEIESEITEGVRAYAIDDARRTDEQIALYDQRLGSTAQRGVASDMRATAAQAVAAFEIEVLAARGELEQMCKERNDRREALANFRARNKLDRPPEPPKDHYLLSVVLLGLFCIETLPNAVFFSAGDELGILGGYTVAIVFSFLNIGSGFLGGYVGWTNSQHRRIFRRLAGWVLGLAAIMFVILINLLVAHMREAASDGLLTSQAALRAWETLRTHPLAVRDALSFGLAATGCIFGLFAMAKGFGWRDPYPGYAKVAEHLASAERRWNELIEERLSYLEGVEKSHADVIRSARSSLRDQQAQVPEILASRLRLVRSFAAHLQHLEGVGRYALAAYRDGNRQARSEGVPVPAHFNELWMLTGISVPEAQSPVPAVEDTEWRAANSALEHSIGQLQTAYQDAIHWVKALSETGDAQAADLVLSATEPNLILHPKSVIDGRAA